MNRIPEEILPIVDEAGNVEGKAERSLFHTPGDKKLLHPVVHLQLLNTSGRIFLQLRPEYKKIQPGKWDTAVGGHVSYGEEINQALSRESMEEIGVKTINAVFSRKYIWETRVERELVYLFYLISDISPIINKEEVADGRFWEFDEIRQHLRKRIFTPNLLKEIEYLQEMGLYC